MVDEDDVEEPLPTLAQLPLFIRTFAGQASPYAVALYSHLLRCCEDEQSEEVSLSLEDLAKPTCMTLMRARQAMGELRQLGVASYSGGSIWVEHHLRWRAGRAYAYPQDCHVYLLQHGARFKIGFSTQYEIRVQAIQRMLPSECKLVHLIRTDKGRQLEKFWHCCFKHLRDKGEWFHLEDKEVTWMCKTADIRNLSDSYMADLWWQYRVYAYHFYPDSKAADELVWFFADAENRDRYADILMHIWGLAERPDPWGQAETHTRAWVHP